MVWEDLRPSDTASAPRCPPVRSEGVPPPCDRSGPPTMSVEANSPGGRVGRAGVYHGPDNLSLLGFRQRRMQG